MEDQFTQGLLWFLAGSALTLVITYVQARFARKQAEAAREELMTVFRAFAQLAEERGWVEWGRDAKGRISTGRVIRMKVEPATLNLTGYAPTVTVSGDAPDNGERT